MPRTIPNYNIPTHLNLEDPVQALADTPATEAQLTFIESLRRSRDIGRMGPVPADLTKSLASEAITWLKARPFKSKPAAREITEGTYVDDNAQLFKVVPNKDKTGLYLKQLVGSTWEYVGRVTALPESARRITLDEAKAFGRRTGVCCECGRTLTNPVSIAEGIGPVCAGRWT